MWLLQLPLLTKGPFALMYGGEGIIDQVGSYRLYWDQDMVKWWWGRWVELLVELNFKLDKIGLQFWFYAGKQLMRW